MTASRSLFLTICPSLKWISVIAPATRLTTVTVYTGVTVPSASRYTSIFPTLTGAVATGTGWPPAGVALRLRQRPDQKPYRQNCGEDYQDPDHPMMLRHIVRRRSIRGMARMMRCCLCRGCRVRHGRLILLELASLPPGPSAERLTNH